MPFSYPKTHWMCSPDSSGAGGLAENLGGLGLLPRPGLPLLGPLAPYLSACLPAHLRPLQPSLTCSGSWDHSWQPPSSCLKCLWCSLRGPGAGEGVKEPGRHRDTEASLASWCFESRRQRLGGETHQGSPAGGQVSGIAPHPQLPSLTSQGQGAPGNAFTSCGCIWLPNQQSSLGAAR